MGSPFDAGYGLGDGGILTFPADRSVGPVSFGELREDYQAVTAMHNPEL